MNWMDLKVLKGEMADWLNKMVWDYFLTGTFRMEIGTKDPFTAKKRFFKYIEKVRIEYALPNIDHFLAIEPHKTGLYHCHALLNGLAGVPDDALWELWFNKYGRNTVEIYDPKLGAHHYLTKYIVKDVCDWDIKVRKSSQLKLFEGKG